MSTPVQIQHEENDPICLRASIGGHEDDGFYITYRGDRKKVLECLKAVLRAFEVYQKIPELKVESHVAKTNFGSS